MAGTKVQENGSNGACQPAMTNELRARFCKTLAKTCNVTASAKAIGFSRQHMHYLRRENKEFAKDWANAIEEATDDLESAARTRAITGYTRPIYQRGELVGNETCYSDTLMALLLKAHRPEKFREKGFDLPPGSEIVIAMRTAGADGDAAAVDVTPVTEKVEKISD